jgi:hypothetical protein
MSQQLNEGKPRTREQILADGIKDTRIKRHAIELYTLAQTSLTYLQLESYTDKDELIAELKRVLNEIDIGWP